ncbi:MAG: Asp-tRNA(Asn)/Glu-tRNA(Gln) amidotransferase subunit GatC [Patescibacteria group bacterium]
MKGVKFTTTDVKYIAALANIPITSAEEEKLAQDFNTTMAVVDELFKVPVAGIEPTHQVTGLANAFREDEVDVERMFTQDQALFNAPRTYNGFFVVERVIAKDE